MTLTIDVPTELEQRLEAEAKRQGVSRDAFVRITLEEKLKPERESSASTLPRILARNLPVKDRSRENEWLAEHRDEYDGKYVALDGDRLIAVGDSYKEVATVARGAGVPDALLLYVEGSNHPPYVGM